MTLTISIRNLRKLIAEEVFRNLAWSAGFGGSGLSSSNRATGSSELPGLGDDKGYTEKEHEEKEQEEQQRFVQHGAAADSRKGGRYRTTRNH